jgi:serine/threonine protein kinase
MAPECFAGGHVGEKADVYSLGCMLLECVTGERPWQGLNVVQVAFQVGRQAVAVACGCGCG